MLILSRKKDDRIMIGDDIMITVVECEGDRVKIGIDAPKNVRVFRKELI
ncbi:MAG: carbon storage regulator CsrA, partial [Oscillospiraceae bacterium]|nr:carbon storage regulator CsrA [Oscillospiraceae bacterium]